MHPRQRFAERRTGFRCDSRDALVKLSGHQPLTGVDQGLKGDYQQRTDDAEPTHGRGVLSLSASACVSRSRVRRRREVGRRVIAGTVTSGHTHLVER
jgi:hypothetical protein